MIRSVLINCRLLSQNDKSNVKLESMQCVRASAPCVELHSLGESLEGIQSTPHAPTSDAETRWLLGSVGVYQSTVRRKTTVEKYELFPDDLKAQIPKLYSQEGNEDPMVYMKLFTPWTSWTWY